jgi:hypothetical protein
MSFGASGSSIAEALSIRMLVSSPILREGVAAKLAHCDSQWGNFPMPIRTSLLCLPELIYLNRAGTTAIPSRIGAPRAE